MPIVLYYDLPHDIITHGDRYIADFFIQYAIASQFSSQNLIRHT
ncbi:hypothetical protein RV15_GL002952 [Enterococcus silesiacus]|uniref:Uncharacterized protein n=1 Tax=Enterococcus silesiacus TaxID=332949 RepID=A0AA91GLJ9_9ENTE|nr:hypothetical protein RV15_GL002952 [Enterococcus silesiacus]